jgi:acetyl esterase/lipase
VALILVLSISSGFAFHGIAPDSGRVVGPVVQVYAQIDTVTLKAYVFMPSGSQRDAQRPAIVIFHGGGWTIGEPAWAFSRAEHFAARGMVAIAAQYRLSNQSTITPLEAMADARAIIRWMRTNAASLGLNPDLIAAYGWSAGAHLAVWTAIFDDATSKKGVSAVPNALILVSPAVDLENDNGPNACSAHANVKTISPVAHVRVGCRPPF